MDKMNRSSSCLDSDSVGSINMAPWTTNGKYMVRYIENFSNDRLDVYTLADNVPQTGSNKKSLEKTLNEFRSIETDAMSLLDSNPQAEIPILLEPGSKVEDIGISPTRSIVVVSYSDKPYLHYWNLEKIDPNNSDTDGDGDPDGSDPDPLFNVAIVPTILYMLQ